MRVGLNLSRYSTLGSSGTLGMKVAQIARRAEDAGFDSIWVWDHLFWDSLPVGQGVTDKEMLEAYTTLGFIAGVTRTIQIGTLVTGVTYRHPGLLVKQVTTLDVLSAGRAYFGIGAAWFEEEHRALGIPFPSRKERFERLEETLQIAFQMWSDHGSFDEARPYNGKHYHLARTLNVPQSVQRPHPPILIGGNGEQKTLRLVAQYGDACNLSGPPTSLVRKLEILREHCEHSGRRYSSIEKTVRSKGITLTSHDQGGKMSPQQVIDQWKMLADLGFDTVIVLDDAMNLDDPKELDLWATKVLPIVHTLPIAGR